MSQTDESISRSRIEANLAGFQRIEAVRPELKSASVALTIVVVDGVSSLLITRRAPSLRAHAGQWALPGGRRDAGESIEDAGRRELSEETGLRLDSSAVLGRLDDYVTRSGYVISPIVVWAGETDAAFAGAESEVTRVHVVPLVELDVEPRLIMIPESDAPVIQLPLMGRYIHAPTAAVIHQFCQVALHGLSTRVAHFEQPVFAWK